MHVRQLYACNFWAAVWGIPFPVPEWQCTCALSEVHEDIVWHVYVEELQWPWPQPFRTPFGWIGMFNICAQPHQCRLDRTGANSHRHTPKSYRKIVMVRCQHTFGRVVYVLLFVFCTLRAYQPWFWFEFGVLQVVCALRVFGFGKEMHSALSTTSCLPAHLPANQNPPG